MEVIDLSHLEVVKIGENAFADCVALADISFPSTIPTFGVKVFERCTELSRIMETLDNEKVFAFFQDQASSLPFSYFARSPVSALDDLKTLPPPPSPSGVCHLAIRLSTARAEISTLPTSPPSSSTYVSEREREFAAG